MAAKIQLNFWKIGTYGGIFFNNRRIPQSGTLQPHRQHAGKQGDKHEVRLLPHCGKSHVDMPLQRGVH